MYRIDAGSSPTELLQQVRRRPDEPDVPPVDYRALTSEVKAAVRRALYEAQRGRCAYCEEKLVLELGEPQLPKTKIEHFHPQRDGLSDGGPPPRQCLERTSLSRLDRADVSWGNLLLCCMGGSDKSNEGKTDETSFPGSRQRRRQQHCDTSKADADICATFYNPRNIGSHVVSLITVAFDGRAFAAYFPGAEAEAQAVLDRTLNLNRRTLQDNRAKVFSGYLKNFTHERARDAGSTPNEQLRQRFVRKARRDASEGKSYPSTLESVAKYIERRSHQ